MTVEVFHRVICARVTSTVRVIACIGFTVFIGACGQNDRVLNDFATIDYDAIEVVNDRLPSVAQQGEPLKGPVYRTTLRVTAPADLVAHYDPNDPQVRQNRLAWDDMTAEYFFYCDSPAPLMSLVAGREWHRLHGQDIRVIDGDADAKQRVFIDWRQIQDEGWGGDDGIGTKAAARVCKRVRKLFK